MRTTTFSGQLLGLLLALLSNGAVACSCNTLANPSRALLRSEFANAKAVFVGTVTEVVVTGNSDDIVRFRVTEGLKAASPDDIVQIWTPEADDSCAFGFDVGKRYLIYASPDMHGGMYVDGCSYSDEYRPRTRELRTLRKAAKDRTLVPGPPYPLRKP